VPIPTGPVAPIVAPAAPPTRPARTRSGAIGVSLVLVAAGLLFTTSAHTAHSGTPLRGAQHADLADLLAAENSRVEARTQRVTALRNEVQRETKANAGNSETVKSLEQGSSELAATAGLLAVSGPGLTVSLNDAPRDVPLPAQAAPDDLVVHQQDVQAVVNALWAGGAEAMMLQDQRVISTSAVRCVGNTLILQGRVYSPPYTITAIGDVKKMQAAMDSSTYISYYLQYVAALRLGWSVKKSEHLTLPAYAGSLTLSHAQIAGSSPIQSKATQSSSP
jgi:uncharacterized protein YlxW (UPF0749 family)